MILVNGRISHDVTATILVSQNNETVAMLVSQTCPLGVELFSFANAFFVQTILHRCWPREWRHWWHHLLKEYCKKAPKGRGKRFLHMLLEKPYPEGWLGGVSTLTYWTLMGMCQWTRYGFYSLESKQGTQFHSLASWTSDESWWYGAQSSCGVLRRVSFLKNLILSC